MGECTVCRVGGGEEVELKENTEHIPSVEEVRGVFDRVLDGKSYTDVKIKDDEKGLYLWDIRVEGEGGKYDEYMYMRGGTYPDGRAKNTTIHVAYYDSDGMPEGGTSVAKYVEGRWIVQT
jgi:hypothetical protein